MPALPRFLRTAFARLASGALLAAVATACTTPSLDTPAIAPTEPQLAKSAPVPGVTVSSTRPAYADRGTTVDVHVIGTGFVVGAQATWLLHGVADPAKVRTNSTTYVSSSEVVANVTVSSDADLAFWDVQIMAAGKNGVGTEVFEITTAEYLGPASDVTGMSDAGQLSITITTSGAFVYDPSLGMINLGPGWGQGIDPLGTVVLGRSASSFATTWIRQASSATYSEQTLPQAPGSVSGNAMSGARDALGTLLVGGWQSFPAAKRSEQPVNRPALWRYDGVWSAPTLLTLPSGSFAGAVRDINGKGQAVGRIDQTFLGAVWDTPTEVTKLDGVANAINAAGTIIVGFRSGTIPEAVYWYRATSGAWNPIGVKLPAIGGNCEEARDVNDAGVIVGRSCDATNKSQAVVWRVNLSGPTPVFASGPQRLPGLGARGSTSGEQIATKISSTAPYVIAGIASSNLTPQSAVRWRTW